MNISKTYWSIYGKICGHGATANILHFQYLATRHHTKTLKSLLSERSGSIIDFGCGAKPYKQWFENYSSYVGVDMYEAPEVDVLVEDGGIPLDDNQFDIALATQVFEHTESLDYLSELHRVLKKGGEVIISVPFLYHVHHEYDFRRFTEQGLVHTLTKYGFSVGKYYKLGAYGSTQTILLLGYINEQLGKTSAGKIIKGLILPLWVPLCLCMNIWGMFLDKIDLTGRFYNNQLIIATKL